MRRINAIYFYIGFFVLNIINTYLLTSGVVHPNISAYNVTFNSLFFSMVGNIGVLLIFFALSWIIFPRTKGRMIFLLVFSLILTILCFGLAVFANIFSTFFRFSHLACFQNPTQENYIIFYAKYALSLIQDFTQFIHLIPFFALTLLFIFTNKATPYINRFRYSMLLGGLILSLIPVINIQIHTKDTIYENSLSGLYGSHQMGVYQYYFYDMFAEAFRKDKPLLPSDQEEIETFLSYYENPTYLNPIDQQTYTVANDFTNLAADKNLIVIQLEAFNDFLINLEVDGIEITPNLNNLANQGIHYNQFYSTSGIGNTSDCEFSALTGLYGNGNDLTIFEFAGNNYETLSKDFKKDGYDTFSLHGNIGDFYYRNVEHLNTLGFDEHYDLSYYESLGEELPLIHSYLDDHFFMNNLADILETKTRYFAYSIMLTAHSPYVPAAEIPTFPFQNLTALSKSYLEYNHFIDEAIGEFISKMAEKDLLDDAVIVIYGDHTSSLFKGDYEAIVADEVSDIEFRKQMQNVPLIVYNEDLFAPSVNDKVCGTVDLYRSMSNLFGLSSKYHFGTDIFTTEPTFIYSPRNLDIWLDDGTIIYPSSKIIGNIPYNEVLTFFEQYKRLNDLILKTHYFNNE